MTDLLSATPGITAAVVDDDAVNDVRRRARACLAEADSLLRSVDPAWSPPPYDPLLVAQALGIRCLEVADESFQAAMICVRDGQPVILYRRHRDLVKTRFSLFHEIAHTLFPEGRRAQLGPGPGSPLLEPEGRLERLCDAAALEMMLPSDHFDADLEQGRFGADRVPDLCARYGAGLESVALRMVDRPAAPACAVVLVEHDRPTRWRQRQEGGTAPDFAVTYAAYSRRARERACFLARRLGLPRDSALRTAARRGKGAAGTERLPLLTGDSRSFRVEALPLTDRPRRKGHSAVLAFIYL